MSASCNCVATESDWTKSEFCTPVFIIISRANVDLSVASVFFDAFSVTRLYIYGVANYTIFGSRTSGGNSRQEP
jgi:hypothetical protein